MNAQHIGGVW